MMYPNEIHMDGFWENGDEILGHYFKNIARSEPLSRQREEELVVRIQEGDRRLGMN
jgi:hypothetical protein